MNLSSIQKNSARDTAHPTSSLNELLCQKLNVQEAASFLGLSVSTLNKMRLSGSGPRYLKLGRRVLYDIRDVEEWVAKRVRYHTSE